MHMSSSRDWGQSSPRAKTGPSTDNEHHVWGYIEAPTSGAAQAGTTFFFTTAGESIYPGRAQPLFLTGWFSQQ